MGEWVDGCMLYSDLDKGTANRGDQNYFQLDVPEKILRNHKIFDLILEGWGREDYLEIKQSPKSLHIWRKW